jgi:hypothetical protein
MAPWHEGDELHGLGLWVAAALPPRRWQPGAYYSALE